MCVDVTCGYVCTCMRVICVIFGKNGYAGIRVHVSLVRVRTLRHTCPYASTRRRFARVSGWTVRGAYMYVCIYIWGRVTYARGICLCMCARENDGARVGFEKQVPACRVPRGRLDSEAATRRAGSTGNDECAALWIGLALAPAFPPRIRLLPSRSRSCYTWTNERLPGTGARCYLSPPTENQYVGSLVLSPAKSQFLHSTSEPSSLICDLSRPRIGATRSIWPRLRKRSAMTSGSFFSDRWTSFLRASSRETLAFCPSSAALKSAGEPCSQRESDKNRETMSMVIFYVNMNSYYESLHGKRWEKKNIQRNKFIAARLFISNCC